jgi:hypothetical protein
VLTAIRANGDNKTIMIPGDGWSNATYWSTYNGATPFITDPANNYYYEAHEYFDSDFSGTMRRPTIRNWPPIRNWPRWESHGYCRS